MTMKTILLTALAALSGLAAQAQTFDLKADIHTTEYDGLTIYLTGQDVTDRERTVVLDSCRVTNGQYHFSVAAPDSALTAMIALPPKDAHFLYGLSEIMCIVEEGTVNVDVRGNSYRLSGGRLNQQYDDLYLRYERDVQAETARMMEERQKAEAQRPYTDAENEAYSERLRVLYDSIRPHLRDFIAWNITNKVGARLFLTAPRDFWPADFYAAMREQVYAPYRYRADERDRRAADAVAYAQEARKATKAGHPYRDFASQTTDGRDVRFADYVEKGKVTLLDFWASWCVPCIQESKELKELYAEYHDRGFNIVSVSLDTARARWLAAIERHALPWTHLSSVKGFKDPGAIEYAVSAIPFVVLIDQNGQIAQLNMHGPVLKDKIRELMRAL